MLAACSQQRAEFESPVGQKRAPRPMYKVGSPYQIGGVWYYPAVDYNYDEAGVASWYGEAFHGKDTANGESFDLNAMTAAHRRLPFGTQIRVCHSGCVTVRVNDRGPWVRGRDIDLSRSAA